MKKNLINGMLVMLLISIVCVASAVADDTVTRDLADSADAGATITVNLTVDVETGATNYIIDEIVPSGWNVTSATGGGDYAQAGHVMWVIHSGATDIVHSYIVDVPADASGTYTFGDSSYYVFEGMSATTPILGDTVMTVGDDISVPDIVINEIMYDPDGDEKWYEWIELYNNDTEGINVDGWILNGTIGGSNTILSGTMSAGTYLLIAINVTAFQDRYPGATCPIIEGNWSALANSGDTIDLWDSTPLPIGTVTYTDITSENHTAERNATGGWDASIVDGGTPCAENSVLADVYGVTISQPDDQTTDEGVNATYVLTIENTGNTADTYALSFDNIDSASTVALNKTTMTLAAGESEDVSLDVTNTTAGTFNVTVTAASVDATATTDHIMTTVEPAAMYGVTISQPVDQTTTEGVNATYVLTIENTGTAADTYALSFDNIDSASTVALNKTTMTLAAGESEDVSLDVTNTAAGTFNVTVTAASADANDTTGSIMTTVEEAATYSVTISQPDDQTTDEGVNATYVLTVENTGNTADTYALSFDNIDSASTVALNKTTMTLAAGESEDVSLDVTNTAAGTFNVTVTAASADANDTTGSIMTTVEAVGDTTPPDILGATLSPNAILSNGADSTTLTVQASSSIGIASVTVNLSAIGGPDEQALAGTPMIGTGTWTTTFNATSDGTFDLTVTVTDDDGNSNTEDVTLTAGPHKYTLELKQSWNMITLPYNVTAVGIDTTQKLGDLITNAPDAGIPCYYVAWFNATSQKMECDLISPPDGVPQDTTYPIVGGQAYFVFVGIMGDDANKDVAVVGTLW